MSLQLHIIQASEFIRAIRKGEGNLATEKHLLAKLARVARRREVYEILVDARECIWRHSTFDIWEIAAALQKYDVFVGRKIAILVTGTTDKAEFLKLCAQNRGYFVNVFHNYEDAINWLFCLTDVSPEAPREPARG